MHQSILEFVLRQPTPGQQYTFRVFKLISHGDPLGDPWLLSKTQDSLKSLGLSDFGIVKFGSDLQNLTKSTSAEYAEEAHTMDGAVDSIASKYFSNLQIIVGPAIMTYPAHMF